MLKLTKTQIQFLDQHCISTDQVFDATGMSKYKYQKLMNEGNYVVAIGVSRCAKGNHSLRSKTGHCVICKPANLAFQKRYETPGDLYVFYSTTKKMVKIGVSDDVYQRVEAVNKQSYGSINDWKLKFHVRVLNAGRAEKIIHDALAEYKKERLFIKDGVWATAHEIFSCSAKYAIEMIKLRLE